jgi:hypothetical protein
MTDADIRRKVLEAGLFDPNSDPGDRLDVVCMTLEALARPTPRRKGCDVDAIIDVLIEAMATRRCYEMVTTTRDDAGAEHETWDRLRRLAREALPLVDALERADTRGLDDSGLFDAADIIAAVSRPYRHYKRMLRSLAARADFEAAYLAAWDADRPNRGKTPFRGRAGEQFAHLATKHLRRLRVPDADAKELLRQLFAYPEPVV